MDNEYDFYAEAMRANLTGYHALPFRCTLHLDDGTGRTITGRTSGKLDKAGRITVFATPDALPFDVLQSPAVSAGDYLLQIRCAPEGVDIHALESGEADAGTWARGMSEHYLVRDKHTLKVLATYTSRAALYADWFVREGNLWIPRAEIVAVTQGSMADELYAMMSDPDAAP